MIKKTLKNNFNYIFFVLFSIATFMYYKQTEYYMVVKYITTFRAIDIMASILFTFILFKLYFDSYYYIILNRYNIITRLGRKKYILLIMKQIFIPSLIFFTLNIILDFILTGTVNIIYILINMIFTIICVIVLPKRKEYNNEFLIVLGIFILIKIICFKFFIY